MKQECVVAPAGLTVEEHLDEKEWLNGPYFWLSSMDVASTTEGQSQTWISCRM